MQASGVAKFLMHFWEVRPDAESPKVCCFGEIFNHESFLKASQEEKNAILLKASQWKYEEERDYTWDHYFGIDLKPMLEGKTILDLGCGNGGRGIAWAEHYGLKHLIGVEVNDIYLEAAKRFSASHGVSAEYRQGVGESLPLDDQSVDAVLTFDVFEHVREPARVLQECHRVLKDKGMAFIVFPSFYQPIEHHLGMVTLFPGIHWLFSGKTLIEAYRQIIDERGPAAQWYQRRSPGLEPWERCHTINGLTMGKFERLIRDGGWEIARQPRIPFGLIGRNAAKKPWIGALAALTYPATFIPGLRELLQHRATYILQKK